MDTKHTPGPWTVVDDGSYSSCLAEVGNLIVSARHEVHDRLNDDVNEANARLVAAAPELLEALQAIIDGPGLSSVPDNDVQALITAAIAKATQP